VTPEAIDAALRQIREALDALAPVIGDARTASQRESSGSRLGGEAPDARIAEFERQLAARDEFIATIAHELRNPLTPLVFQARVITARLASPNSTESVSPDWVLTEVRRLEHQLQRVTEVLDGLLDLSRLSSGRIDLRLEDVDLGEVLRDVISGFQAELAMSECEVRLEHTGPLVGLWDRMRIEQVCRNLLSNAFRYGARRPIDVRIEGDDAFVVLTVRDYGVGIDRQHQQRIFERFERGSVDRRGEGFGVGLWVVKSICLALGGTVSVESDIGKGAKFVVILPRKRTLSATGGLRERRE
jgi:signal transduction histidine kinase